jgi:predicted metal-dependent phosphoesterase TrpH
MPIAWDEVLNYGGIPRKPEDVQKKIIFNLMAEKGYTDTWIEAKLLCRNNPEYGIKRKKPSAVEIIRLIHEVGGIAILAHPYLIDDVVRVDDRKISRDDFIDWLIAEGLDGIEASYTYDKTTYGGELTKEEIIQKVKKDYSNRVKIISGGSDYHADYKRTDQKVRDIGECGITYEYFSNNALLSKLEGGDQNEGTT